MGRTKEAVARVQKCILKALNLFPVTHEPPEVVTAKVVIRQGEGAVEGLLERWKQRGQSRVLAVKSLVFLETKPEERESVEASVADVICWQRGFY